jgi:hypothetical protein
METENNFKFKSLYTVIMEADIHDTLKYRPILHKISDSSSYLYLFRSKETILFFLNKYKIPAEKCKIVKSNNPFIKKTINDLEGKVKIEFKIFE